MEQIVAAIGPRNPPPERAPKVFNIGFVYFLLPGQEPDPELLRELVRYRDRALEHWRHVTGGRGQLSNGDSRSSSELTRSTAAEPVHQGGAAEGPRTADSRRRGSAGTAWNAGPLGSPPGGARHAARRAANRV